MTTRAVARTADAIDAAVGRRVRILRHDLGLSQAEVAERIGVSAQQLQKYENGLNRIPASRLVRLAAVLSVYPGYFFRDGDPGTPDADRDDASEEARLLRNFRQIKDGKARQILADLAERMAAGRPVSRAG